MNTKHYHAAPIILFLFLIFPTISFAQTVHVNADGSGDYLSIQAAIDNAVNGDIVIVSPAAYFENINFRGKNITLTSTAPDDPDTVAATIINAGGSGSVVTFANGESTQAVLSGFTITNGYGTVSSLANYIYWGAGIYCENASPTIMDNVIVGNNGPIEMDGDNPENWKVGYGGAIGCIFSDAVITRNIIKANSTMAAGGIFTIAGNAKISNNLIYDNNAQIGGGVVLFGGKLINNTIVNNIADIAGNLYLASESDFALLIVSNNIIANAQSGGGILFIQNSGTGYDNITYNNIWGNNGGDYLEFGNQTGINGNISKDPLFENQSIDNYHLLYDSPCINAGDPDFTPQSWETDFDNQPRVSLLRVDIGAYEFTDLTRPVANAGQNQLFSSSVIPSLITLDGSDSFDHGGEPITYYWQQIEGPTVELSDASAVNPTFVPSILAIYVFELIVTNDEFDSIPDTVAITIDNQGPMADAGPDQLMAVVPDRIKLDANAAFDPDGDTISYRWNQVDGLGLELVDANTSTPYFEPIIAGVYSFELVVNDGLLDSQPDVVNIVIGENNAPVADAGLPCYAANEPVVLDATASYDPDGYGTLSCQWTQVSGPSVNITGANTPNPIIDGFTQTNAIQYCRFELQVSDGDLTSSPDTVDVIIVPNFGSFDLYLTNPPFDPDKPTIVAFGGGNCYIGGGMNFGGIWAEKANWFTVDSYSPPYTKYAHMLIVYLSSIAPDYAQPIQTMGFSTGNMPAIDVAIHINRSYDDPRYAVNRVSLLDAACRYFASSINSFLNSAVDGEQCWIDSYIATHSRYYSGVLNTRFSPPANHGTPPNWYIMSAYESSWPNGDFYNNGITAGYYYSLIGPGKNLQLASYTRPYYFKWIDAEPDYLDFYSESSFPGKLPQAVTLIGPADGNTIDANGVVLTCQESENAVGYQLLFGADPDRVMDYDITSDTPNPPTEIITELPYEETWWTVRAYDQYGSTIYADPGLITLPLNTIPDANAGENIIAYAASNGFAKITLDASASCDEDGDNLTCH